VLHSVVSVEDKAKLLEDFITIGLDNIMPERVIKIHSNDAPWMTTDLKSQIKKRQMALAGGNVTFKYYRNMVNRNRKKCRSKYYLSKVHNLKNSRPKNWWKEVKRISGHSTVNNHSDLISLLANAIDNFDHMSPEVSQIQLTIHFWIHNKLILHLTSPQRFKLKLTIHLKYLT
jgi:hypothetical protein